MARSTGLTVAFLGAAALACAAAGQRTGGAPATPRDDGADPARAAHAPRGAAPGEGPAALADAERALAAGDRPRAEAILRAAAGASPRDPRPLLALSRLHVAQRRFGEAVDDLDRAAAIRESAEVLLLRGRALALDRRFDPAARDLERALELDPRSSEAWAVLGALQVNRGDHLEAEWALEAAASISGGSAAADRFWTQLLAIPPDPIAPQETLARCTRGYVAGLQGEWLEAERELRNGLRFAPRYGWCLAQWAEALGRTGELARSERAFRQAIADFSAAQRPLRADAEGRLAALLVSTGRSGSEAVALARGAVAVRGEQTGLLFVLGRACDGTGDVACSRDAYRRVLALPHVPEALRRSAEDRLRAIDAGPATAR